MFNIDQQSGYKIEQVDESEKNKQNSRSTFFRSVVYFIFRKKVKPHKDISGIEELMPDYDHKVTFLH